MNTVLAPGFFTILLATRARLDAVALLPRIPKVADLSQTWYAGECLDYR